MRSQAIVVAEGKEAAALLSPLKSSRMQAIRALAIAEVPLAALAGTAPRYSRDWPQRIRMPVLEAWRNERLIYKRPPGSVVPEVCAVAVNLGPRPDDVAPRQLGCTALQVPQAWPEGGNCGEVAGLSGPVIESRSFTLPATRGARQPCTAALGQACGLLHVHEGAVRYLLVGGAGEVGTGHVELFAGDTAVLSKGSMELLVVAGAAAQPCSGARFRWVHVKDTAVLDLATPALGDAEPEVAPEDVE